MIQSNGSLFSSGIFSENPVIVGALGISPIIAGALTLKMGAALAAIMLVLMLGVSIFNFHIGHYVKEPFKIPANMLVSAILIVPCYMLAEWIMGDSIDSLGIFAPMMIFNSALNYYAYNVTSRRMGSFLAQTMGKAAGFAVIIIPFSAVREIIMYGTVWDIKVQNLFTVPEAGRPFLGFIALGFAAAFCNYVRSKYTNHITEKERGVFE